MINHVSIPVLPQDVGKAFSHASNWEQGSIINEMSRELYVSCKGDRGFETQCCYISDKLDSNGVKLIEHLAEFIKLREESTPKSEGVGRRE